VEVEPLLRMACDLSVLLLYRLAQGIHVKCQFFFYNVAHKCSYPRMRLLLARPSPLFLVGGGVFPSVMQRKHHTPEVVSCAPLNGESFARRKARSGARPRGPEGSMFLKTASHYGTCIQGIIVRPGKRS
jgi:hypothetical protein